MSTSTETLIELERRFWRSMIENDPDTAVDLLNEPAVMVSSHGAIQFDHDGYRQMAEKGPMVLTSFELSDIQVVFPDDKTAILAYRVKQGVAPRGKSASSSEQEMNDTSTWINTRDGWRCVLHTETPANAVKKSS